MTTTDPGRAGDPTAQVPEGLRKIALRAAYEFWGNCDGRGGDVIAGTADAVLAALFAACEVREQPHMVLGDNTRTGRALILRYPLPDLPIPPAPEGLADLIRSRIGTLPPVPAFPDDEEETR